jgi:hypothetical protein
MDWQASDLDARSQAGPIPAASILAERTRARLDHLVRRDLEPFLRAMRRRLDHDCGRLHQYHADLRGSSLSTRSSPQFAAGEKAETDRKRESMRVAIEREYAAKLDDLRHNYALRVKGAGAGALRPRASLRGPDQATQGERIVAIDWHPAIRMMEPPLCDWASVWSAQGSSAMTDLAGQAPLFRQSEPATATLHHR